MSPNWIGCVWSSAKSRGIKLGLISVDVFPLGLSFWFTVTEMHSLRDGTALILYNIVNHNVNHTVNHCQSSIIRPIMQSPISRLANDDKSLKTFFNFFSYRMVLVGNSRKIESSWRHRLIFFWKSIFKCQIKCYHHVTWYVGTIKTCM